MPTAYDSEFVCIVMAPGATECHNMPNMPQQSKRYRTHIWHLIPVGAESLSKVDAKQAQKN
jgi:hypothetical protein